MAAAAPPPPLAYVHDAPCPGAALTTANQGSLLGVFVIDANGAMQVLWWSAALGWTHPTAVTGANYLPTNASLSAGTRSSGELDTFGVDATGVLKYMSFDIGDRS